jgi:hypothetical protein
MKEDVKLHILLGRWNFWRSSWVLGAGECVKIGRFWRFFTHRSTHRLAGDLGVAASESARQTTYSMRMLDFFEVILATWCRGKGGFPYKSG